MDTKNDIVTAYCAGYEAAKYDMKGGGVLNYSNVADDGKAWLTMMIKTGAIRLETEA